MPNLVLQDEDRVFRFDLTTAYDISTCLYANNVTFNLDTVPYKMVVMLEILSIRRKSSSRFGN